MSSRNIISLIALISSILLCVEPIWAVDSLPADYKSTQAEPEKDKSQLKNPGSESKIDASSSASSGGGARVSTDMDTSIEQTISNAKTEFDNDRLDLAIKQFEEAIFQIEKGRIEKGSESDRRHVQALGGLAQCFVRQGKLTDAERTLKNAFQIEKLIDKGNALTSDAAIDLAAVYFQGAKYAEAEEIYSALLARKKIAGKEDQALATTMYDFGRLRFKQGNYSEAERMLKESAEIMERLSDYDKFAYAKTLGSLALCYANQEKTDQAEVFYKRACADLEISAPPNSGVLVQTLREYAGLLRLQGRKQEALKISERAMKIGTYANKEYRRSHPDFRVNYQPYMKELQRKIKRFWSPPSQDKTKKVAVIFKIHKAGELSDLRIAESSGVDTADNAAIDAVTQASPFARLPYGSPNEVDVQFVFDYNVWKRR